MRKKRENAFALWYGTEVQGNLNRVASGRIPLALFMGRENMAMTKKDFISLADHLRGLSPPAEILAAVVRFCRSQNSRFMESRWLNYLRGDSGPNGGKVK